MVLIPVKPNITKYNEVVTMHLGTRNAPHYFNIQRINFDKTGYPIMDLPTGYEIDIEYPSGEE